MKQGSGIGDGFNLQVSPDIENHEAEMEWRRIDGLSEEELDQLLEEGGVDFEAFNARLEQTLASRGIMGSAGSDFDPQPGS